MFVEFTTGSTVLLDALRAAPGMSVWTEQVTATDSQAIRVVFWAAGGAFDEFEAAMDVDPTVTDVTVVADVGDHRLYRIQLPPGRDETASFITGVELDGVLIGATADATTGWALRMLFPSSEAFSSFREYCSSTDLSVDIRAVYSEHPHPQHGVEKLTDPQRETLLCAVDAGYFTIPREASLADLAERLGISPQAVSERLRRGMAALVRSALAEGDGSARWDGELSPPRLG